MGDFGLSEWQRRRELAGNERAGIWARDQARRAQRDFIRRTWRLFVPALLLMTAAPIVVAFVVLPTQLLRGVVFGGVVVGVPLLLWTLIVQVTGTAPIMMGDQAEQWTAQELRKMGMRDWRLVNHFSLSGGDIDHVLLGPGGVFAVETKWSASEWTSAYGRQRLTAAVGQARHSARQLGLWHPVKRHDLRVTPVVVLWGGNTREWEPAREVTWHAGVCVVTGHALKRWRQAVPDEQLTAEQIDQTWRAIAEHAQGRDLAERRRAEPLRSPARMVGNSFQALLAAIAAFYSLAQLLGLTGSATFTGVAAVSAALVALLLVRVRVRRPIAWGVASGSGLLGVALLGATALSALLG
jgi:hypothetical protein